MQSKKRNNYKFSDKVHSKYGIVSVIIGMVAFITIIVSTYISSKSAGNGGLVLGLAGFIALLMTIYGFFAAIKALKEKDIFYIFPVIGMALNGLLLVMYVILYIVGFSTWV